MGRHEMTEMATPKQTNQLKRKLVSDGYNSDNENGSKHVKKNNKCLSISLNNDQCEDKYEIHKWAI